MHLCVKSDPAEQLFGGAASHLTEGLIDRHVEDRTYYLTEDRVLHLEYDFVTLSKNRM